MSDSTSARRSRSDPHAASRYAGRRSLINAAINKAFDPYPYILLNLVLSCLAALQAPIIMMSQNRQAVHDRLDAQHDYEVNTKAEIEIVALHTKLDEIHEQKWFELMQVQDNRLRFSVS